MITLPCLDSAGARKGGKGLRERRERAVLRNHNFEQPQMVSCHTLLRTRNILGWIRDHKRNCPLKTNAAKCFVERLGQTWCAQCTSSFARMNTNPVSVINVGWEYASMETAERGRDLGYLGIVLWPQLGPALRIHIPEPATELMWFDTPGMVLGSNSK